MNFKELDIACKHTITLFSWPENVVKNKHNKFSMPKKPNKRYLYS